LQGTNSNKPVSQAYWQIEFKYVGHNCLIIPLMDSGAKISYF
jgi:hypothetical protein